MILRKTARMKHIIITNGLFEDFKKFSENYKGVDHYKTIIGMLITDAEIKQIKK